MNGYHMAAHVWATWHLPIHPNRCHVSINHWSTCLPSCHPSHLPHVKPTTSLVLMCHISMMTSKWYCVDVSVDFFFACWLLTFCLFGKTNRSRYLDHTTFVWAHSSCVGFLRTIPTHTFFFKIFWSLWFLGLSEPYLAPGSNSGSIVERDDICFLYLVYKGSIDQDLPILYIEGYPK